MRRRFFFFSAAVAALMLAGCGGGSSSSTSTTTNHISISPGVVSIVPGQVVSFTAVEQDSTNTNVTKQPTITFTAGTGLTLSTANCSVVGVTGCQVAACAGTFDSNFINCAPGTVPVQATVTATGDSLSASASVFVHQTVTSVVVSPSSTAGCVSTGATQSFTATAFNNATDITGTVGPFIWSSSQSSVATVDNNGLATAASPGTAHLFASAAGVNSLGATFNTCAVRTINLHVTGSANTTFNMTFPSTTQQTLVADVIDANGQSIPASGLTFSVLPNAFGTASGSFNPAMGGIGPVIASCSPPTCNIGLGYDTFSNPVIATVSGAVSGSVWVASSAGSALVGISISSNTAGTPVTLPASPNSLIVGSGQKNAYLGSASGLMIVNISSTSPTATTVTAAPGKVLAVDPAENNAIVANATNVFVVSISSNQVTKTLPIAGATAAAWTPDGFDAYIVAGTQVTQLSPSVSPKTFNLSSAGADVTFLTSGRFAYFAEASGVDVRRPCDNLQVNTVPTSGTPQKIKSLTSESAVLVADTTLSTTGLDVITPTITNGSGCGQAINNTVKFVDLGAGMFTPTELITTPDSNFAFVIGSSNLLVYKVAQNLASTFALAGGAMPLSGDSLIDASSLYVGANDGNVHQLTISGGTLTDARQISVNSAIGGNPDLVALMHR